MGRKRSQGKARKAAKAKAREAAEEEREHNNIDDQTADANGRQQSPADQMQQLQLQSGNVSRLDTTITCRHGFEQTDMRVRATWSRCVIAFKEAFYDAVEDGGPDVSICLLGAANATTDKFDEVWNDSAKMDIVISFF